MCFKYLTVSTRTNVVYMNCKIGYVGALVPSVYCTKYDRGPNRSEARRSRLDSGQAHRGTTEGGFSPCRLVGSHPVAEIAKTFFLLRTIQDSLGENHSRSVSVEGPKVMRREYLFILGIRRASTCRNGGLHHTRGFYMYAVSNYSVASQG